MYAYESDGIDVLLCSFSNPFVGSNAVNVTLTGSRAPTLSCGAVIGSGNHAAANLYCSTQAFSQSAISSA